MTATSNPTIDIASVKTAINIYIPMYVQKKKGIEDDFIMGEWFVFFLRINRSLLNYNE
jgi:hypothetical protein